MILWGRHREVDLNRDRDRSSRRFWWVHRCREKRSGQSTVDYAERTSLLVASLSVPLRFLKKRSRLGQQTLFIWSLSPKYFLSFTVRYFLWCFVDMFSHLLLSLVPLITGAPSHLCCYSIIFWYLCPGRCVSFVHSCCLGCQSLWTPPRALIWFIYWSGHQLHHGWIDC